MSPHPPYIGADGVAAALRTAGHAVLDPAAADELLQLSAPERAAWAGLWNDLPPDAYLRDGGRYRRRRHASFVVDHGHVVQAPHRAHWQPVAYNALHGGIERWFEPLDPVLPASPAWVRLLAALGGVASALRGAEPWYIEAHQFRIDTTDGIGRPTPEGAHRDGVDLVAVMLLARHAVKGGETRVFEAEGPSGIRFTLTEPGSLLLLDDARVIHESTPIQPIDPAGIGHRDTLVLTMRRGGFQDAIPASRRG